jgi:hypothetical protein
LNTLLEYANYFAFVMSCVGGDDDGDGDGPCVLKEILEETFGVTFEVNV